MDQGVIVNDFVDKCLQKWNAIDSEDHRIIFFKNKFKDWIEQLPFEFHAEVLILLENFMYFTKEKVNENLVQLHEVLLDEYAKNQKDTIYSFIISDDGKSNSSNDYWHTYKSINNLAENCYVNLSSERIQWNRIRNIVFIDDFSGSGQSFYKEVEKHKEKFQGKNIIFITICIMEEAINNIKKYCDSNNISFLSLSVSVQDKAFSQNLFEDDELSKRNILNMSSRIGIVDKDDDLALGWGNSQSLVAFYNNTPNNTLKFLRRETKAYFSIFPRGRYESPVRPSIDSLKLKCKEHNKINYSNSIVRR